MVLVAGLACVGAAPAAAQTFSQRGFAEARATAYPQDAPPDDTRAMIDLMAREELFVKPTAWLQFAGGIDLRQNTHDQVDQSWRVDFSDRGTMRPAISVRRLAATLARGPVTVDVGKQFIRWGKTDIVTPTDRFAPRDFLTVIETEFLGVTGARAVAQFGDHTLDLVWTRFTPSRIPLLNQRWALPGAAPGTISAITGIDAIIPNGSQAGIRYSRTGRIEYSLSVFNGFNHLPNIGATPGPQPGAITLTRSYPTMRSYGGDAAVPMRWFTLKGEAAYATSDTAATDDYVLYVVQLERLSGEWQFAGGYAGEVATARRAVATFAPDRGLARAIVARAGYTIDANRSLAFEGAARQNGRGVYSRFEYSQARGQHWRATITGVVVAGRRDDFLGQYNRNSHVVFAARYSF
jgi:hypothetical protein